MHPRHLLLFFLLAALTAAGRTRVHHPSSVGKDYYIEMPMAGVGDRTGVALFSSPQRQRVGITSEGKVSQYSVNAPNTVQLLGGVVRVMTHTDAHDVKGAMRLHAPEPVAVLAQSGISAATKGTYTPIPATAWGTEYYVVGTPEGVNDGWVYYPAYFSVPGIMIIARSDGTSVSITPKAKTAGGHAAGIPYNVSLNAGDVYYVSTMADPDLSFFVREFQACEADFSGSYIVSNNPIAVLTSSSFGSWPCGNQYCGDFGVEQLPPVCQWDTEYVIPPSVPRVGGAQGDIIRVVFSEPNTKLFVDEGSGSVEVGGGSAGDVYDYLRQVSGVRLTADHPILVMNITTKTVGCDVDKAGSEPWNFSFAVQQGVRQWCDNVFAMPGWNASNVLDLVFRFSDKSNITIDGIPLAVLAPSVRQLPGGYAYIRTDFGSATKPMHIRGMNGAVFSGTVFGHGTGATVPGGEQTQAPLSSPLAVNSFAHPIAPTSVALCNPDTIAPRVSVTDRGCGLWDVVAYDDATDPPSTGIADVTLAAVDSADTSFNVALQPAPVFDYGAVQSSFGLVVVNLTQPAQASLHVRDMAGNEFDTTLTYAPQNITVTPSLLDLGSARASDSLVGSIVIENASSSPITFTKMRLRYGLSHHWQMVKAPALPLTVPAGTRDTIACQWTSPDVPAFECDDDTLYVTTCREFPIATLLACNRHAAITTAAAQFSCAAIDSAGYHGDTTTSAVLVMNTGNDTLHVRGATLIGIDPPDVAANPSADFSLLASPPSAAQPWRIGPGDTMNVAVAMHPHHTGPRDGAVVFASDAALPDTALLNGCGVLPNLSGISQGSAPDAFALAAYPNPASSAATIEFTRSEDSRVTVTLTTLLGERVMTIIDEHRTTGTHRISLDVSALRSGVYLCTVRCGANVTTRHLVLQR